MTIEKSNKDFNQLIEQNGFSNTGVKTPTGCEVTAANGAAECRWCGTAIAPTHSQSKHGSATA